MKRRQFVKSAVAAPGALGAWSVQAAPFPEKPIRILLPYANGNLMDTALRTVSDEIRAKTGHQLVIESKPGGAGIIAAQSVAAAPADGYTLLLANTGLYAINPHTFKKLPYDPERSFKPVTNFLGTSMVLAVHSDLGVKTMAEFVAWAKSNPGRGSFASFSMGNPSHFAGIILNKRAGLDLTHIPYAGTPPAVQNLLGGQVTSAFLPLLAVAPHVKSGKVRVLGVSSPKRSSLLPDAPTFREAGFPDLERYLWVAVLAPAGTPDAVVATLNELFTTALNSPKVRGQWREMDFEPLPSTPAEFLSFAREDTRVWGEAVKLSGFKMED